MRHAVIVGASDGIGLAVAEALIARGWKVTGLSRSPSPLAHPAYAHTVADVTSADYRAELEAVVARGEVDACIYCAGVGDPLDLDVLAAERRTFEVNLLGAVTTIEVVLPSMRRAKRGHVVVLSSQGDVLVSSEAPAYHASKAGLSSYVEGLGLALRGTGVTLTNVRLGFVDTKIAKSSVRPFMMSAAEAARLVVGALERRRVRITHPASMAALVWLMVFATWFKILRG